MLKALFDSPEGFELSYRIEEMVEVRQCAVVYDTFLTVLIVSRLSDSSSQGKPSITFPLER